MDQPYLTMGSPKLPTIADAGYELRAALDKIVTKYPPRSHYTQDALHGLWSGPTGIAYMLLRVSVHHPNLSIYDHPAIYWAREYLARGSRGHTLRLGPHGCGIADEKLAYEAVTCAVTGDLADVRQFVSSVAQIMPVEDYPDEMLYGRAGTLYLLRLVRHWVTGSNRLVEPAIYEISNTILNRGPPWKWHDRRYLGAVHGEIGIITQLVLTTPSLAPRLQPALRQLLNMQQDDGNWPSSEESGAGGRLVQFCHGAPGFVFSLIALRPHFPDLRNRFDDAIERARECIEDRGLLKKEPSLCHGIFGNALYVVPEKTKPRRH